YPAHPGRDDSRVVQNQNVARAQALQDLQKTKVPDAAIGALQHQQARLVALSRRRLGDQLGRQVIIEIGSAHAACLAVQPLDARREAKAAVNSRASGASKASCLSTCLKKVVGQASRLPL